MDRPTIERHLEQVNRHLAEGEEHIAKQNALIADLARDGHDTETAKKLLSTLIELQEAHKAHRDRLNKQLSGH